MTAHDWWVIFLIGLCIVMVILPPKYDPAIRLREWMIKKGYRDD